MDVTDRGERDGPQGPSQSCVYVYRNRSGKIVYIGRGVSPQRALSHTGGSHNPRLAELIAGGDYDLEIAGPYNDYETTEQVEAALISVLTRPGTHALFNDVPGHGHRFRPLGVPPEFADRRLEVPLSVSDIGEATGGALIVRNSFGGELEPGRPRLDPLHIDPSILVDNLRRYWQLNRLHAIWAADPTLKPKVILSAAGPVNHRYVPASAFIDVPRLGDEPRDTVPLNLAEADLDACGLRGRMLAGVKFARGQVNHYIWVDGAGRTRSPASDAA